ncbi:MAG: universal stress protein [Cyanobacteria bacterium P01_H01_bin.121]
MFNKVLVAIDSSADSQTIFKQAVDLATSMQASLMVLHVLTNYEEGSPSMPILPTNTPYMPLDDQVWHIYRDQWEAYRKAGLDRLQGYVDLATQTGVAAEFSQLAGVPDQVICNLATTWAADVIVMGSHGRTGLQEFLMGSVSNYVMHHAPCAVLICRLAKTTT